MIRIHRLLVPLLVALGALIVLSGGALAAGHMAGASKGAPGSAPSSGDRDVPGASVDPSRKDHDNGKGNNCDPGFGRGNQKRFGMAGQASDPRDQACASVKGEHEEENAPAQQASGATGASGVSGATMTGGPAAPAQASGNVLAETAVGAAQAAQGAVLAATGSPITPLVLGLLLLAVGVLIVRRAQTA